MPSLEERYRRNDIDDQIYLGQLVERALTGEFGTLMKHIINGLHAEWLAASTGDNKMPADRYLGRLEANSQLLDRLEYMIVNMHNQIDEQTKSKQVGQGNPPDQPQGNQ